MFWAVRQSWSLMVGVAMLMIGNGLLISLLGVRASYESFAPTVTGLVQSGYFAGFFFGSLITPRFVERVGHIRTFAALASVASAATLVHAVFVDPVSWTAMRFVGGLCFAGLYVVSESWLNDSATNETRGQLLSVYIVIQNGGFAGGQIMLNAADPTGATLFILTSVLVSLALVPMLLSAAPAPVFASPGKLSVRQLYRTSPLGMLTIIASGLVVGGYFSLVTVYGGLVGLTVASISVLLAGFTIGGTILQYPVGRLSDRFDRRSVIILVNALAAGVATAVALFGEGWMLFALVFVLGGLAVPTYGLGLSHTNDFVPRDRLVAASAGLVMVYGAAAAFGPLIGASLMQWGGPAGLFWWFAGVHVAVATFGLYRITRRRARPNQEQGAYMAQAASAVQASMALYTDYDETDEDARRIEGGPLFPAAREPEEGGDEEVESR